MKDIHSFVIVANKDNYNLEECIKSVKKQSTKSNVIILAWSKSKYIMDLASDNSIGVIIEPEKNIGKILNSALNSVNTKLVTIVNQNDILDRNYLKEVLKVYKQNKDSALIFTNNYIVEKDIRIDNSKDLFIKRLLRNPLANSKLNNKIHYKKRLIKYRNTVYLSSITFNKPLIPSDIFSTNIQYIPVWYMLKELIELDNRIVYVKEKLVGIRKRIKKKTKTEIKETKKLLYEFHNKKLIDFIYKNK